MSLQEDRLGDKAQEVGKGQTAEGLTGQGKLGFVRYPVGSQQVPLSGRVTGPTLSVQSYLP